jgi:polyphosphate kinase
VNTRFDPELSRLAFEDRLIEFAEDRAIPLLERVRLLAIISERLDVFFMTRLGRLKRLAQGALGDTAEDLLAQQQLVAMEAHRVVARAYRLLHTQLDDLRAHGITIERWDTIDATERARLRDRIGYQLQPLIHPVVIEEGQLMPHVRNLRPALVAEVASANTAGAMAIIELPAEIPRLLALPGGLRFVPVEQVIIAELPGLCDGLEVRRAHMFRVTRNADTDYSAEDDVLESVEAQIVWRPFQDVVRLEVEREMPASMRERLLDELQREAGTPGPSLADRDMYVVDGLLDLSALSAIADIDRPALKRSKVEHRVTRLDALLQGTADDVLLHFPFDDYESSIERLLLEAARHPKLAAMRTTIYRTDENSDVVNALREARARGADVTAVVELKASFDEHENIEWARMLGAEGVRVVLSPPDLKVHAKMALVTFQDGHTPQRIALVGTGNMNAVTARAYVDLWLATSDPERTAEVSAVFDTLEGGSLKVDYARLLVSPFNMRRRFVQLMEREVDHARAGRAAGIRAMVNGLSDPTIIAALHRASQAGVRVDLVVRGVCLLRPGAAESENIRIVSVAGHLLQHARIFHFHNDGDDAWFIGSADWRPRNLDRRVEVIISVTDPAHTAVLDRILTQTFERADAWELGPDGVYVRRAPAAAPPLRAAART